MQKQLVLASHCQAEEAVRADTRQSLERVRPTHAHEDGWYTVAIRVSDAYN